MRVLADTSIWIHHLRHHHRELAVLLEQGRILMHSAVMGELACGSLRQRLRFLADLRCLPPAVEAAPEEVRALIERKKLYGQGLSWVDVHLLASAKLSSARLWTNDLRLKACSEP